MMEHSIDMYYMYYEPKKAKERCCSTTTPFLYFKFMLLLARIMGRAELVYRLWVSHSSLRSRALIGPPCGVLVDFGKCASPYSLFQRSAAFVCLPPILFFFRIVEKALGCFDWSRAA